MHHNSLIFHSKTRENEMLEDIKSKHESVNKSVLKKEEENNQETVHNMGKAQYLTSPKLSFVTLITQSKNVCSSHWGPKVPASDVKIVSLHPRFYLFTLTSVLTTSMPKANDTLSLWSFLLCASFVWNLLWTEEWRMKGACLFLNTTKFYFFLIVAITPQSYIIHTST